MTYPTAQIPRGPTLWPDRTVARLQYTDYTTIYAIPLAGISAGYYYRLNSPFDPRGTGTPGTDEIPGMIEYANQYSRYRTLASSIRLQTFNTDPRPAFAVIAPYTAAAAFSFGPIATTPNDVKILSGNPYAKSRICTDFLNNTLSQYITMEKLHGSTDPLTTATFAASTGAGSTPTYPSQQVYWFVGHTMVDELAVGSVASCQMVVQINYWVEFYARDFEIN